jgi:UDP-N-acetylmuramate dehydrogenase
VSAGSDTDWVAVAAEIERETGVRAAAGKRLADFTTMRVGGPADLLATARDAAALAALVRFARSRGIPHIILGRGSDLVVADAGVRGLVILCRAEGCRVDGTRLIAEAGLPLASAATVAGRAGLTGLEFGLAIPGTVGGAVWANAGAHGSDVASVLESVSVLRADGTESAEPTADLALSYRESRFKHSTADAGAVEVILGATFRLASDDPAAINARMDEIRVWRREHQPLSLPSAGSVFRNPPGDSAGRLIDACGLKGRRVGGAEISAKHANFIVNVGGATAAHVRELAEAARTDVERRFGTKLEYEVQFIGDWPGQTQEVA